MLFASFCQYFFIVSTAVALQAYIFGLYPEESLFEKYPFQIYFAVIGLSFIFAIIEKYSKRNKAVT